jgi:hypothetical protein
MKRRQCDYAPAGKAVKVISQAKELIFIAGKAGQGRPGHSQQQKYADDEANVLADRPQLL